MAVNLDTDILAPLCVALAAALVVSGGALYYAKRDLSAKIAEISGLTKKLRENDQHWNAALDAAINHYHEEIERKDQQLHSSEDMKKRLHSLLDKYSQMYSEDVEYYKKRAQPVDAENACRRL